MSLACFVPASPIGSGRCRRELAGVDKGRPRTGFSCGATSPSKLSNEWDAKSDIYILRSDGFSCSRETVGSDASLKFEHPSSQQHLLVWKSKPKCVMVLKKLGDELMTEFLDIIRFLGEEQGLRVLVEPAVFSSVSSLGPYVDTWHEDCSNDLHLFVDFVVCLGGDGLMLHATHIFGCSIPPIISFKLGSLGFLTCHGYENAREHLNEVINGAEELDSCRITSSSDGSPLTGVRITLRMRLLCELFRNGRRVPGAVHEVMNEVAVSRGAAPYLSKIEVYERDTYLTRVQADGVMLATPTGSTAYSVAAGGSMVHPTVPAILFTPICPHSLSFRPVILPDYAQLVLKIAGDARSSAVATFDGKFITEMMPGDSIHVKMSPHPVPTINYEDQTTDWFNSIERCFKWNDRLEQKKIVTVGRKEKQDVKVLDDQQAHVLRGRILSAGNTTQGGENIGLQDP
jgi:NAD+ kinase